MAPSKVVKHRFQNSLDMIAARSIRNVNGTAQSGTGNAWCIMDSPTLGKMSSGPRRGDMSLRLEESTMASGSRLTGQAVSVAPLNIKKKVKQIRRRGLVSGIHLELPPSPRLPPTPSPPQSAIAFTAEWDLDQNTFIFTPFDSSYPRSTVSPHFAPSPIPVDVEEGPFPHSPAPSTPSVYSHSTTSPRHPHLSALQTAWHAKEETVESISVEPPETPDSSPGTPISPIFDEESLYSHGRKLSQSTTASSMIEDESPISASAFEASIPLHKELKNETGGKGKVNSFSLEGMDRDLVLAPMHAFEQMLWASTMSEMPAKQRPRPARSSSLQVTQSKPLPDVPRGPEPNTSRFSSYSCQSGAAMLNTAVPASNSLRQQLHMQISKALGTVLMKR